MTTPRRDVLVATALDLFDRHGFHATGIDRILAESGVAKMTLYKHFRSKNDLIVAALEQHGSFVRERLRDAVEKRKTSPKKRLLVIFDVLEDEVASGRFQGDLFVKACSEFSDLDDPVHAVAATHKTALRDYIADLAGASGSKDATMLADQIMLLVEGATTVTHVTGRDRAIRQARKTAKQLLNRAGL
ncbi:MAG: TetR family transcriptional regulator [Rhodospirillales bacterium]|nr:TetR family transcriptional regulator [Rhodospirillales bacterium]